MWEGCAAVARAGGDGEESYQISLLKKSSLKVCGSDHGQQNAH